jgi:hypothetical protein
MRRSMILGLCLLVGLTACNGETPTSVSAPGGPSYDSGWLVGSGNKDGSAGSPTITTMPDTTSRTGWLVGSGG